MRIKIGDACEFINGGSWTESDYREYGLPVLKVSNFNSSGFTINDISYLNTELGNKYEKNKLELNDIIIATVGSHPSLVNSAAGRTIRVNSNVVNYYLNQNAICLRVNDDENIDQIYLYYLTETTAFRNFIQQRGKGAANQMRIPISGIKDFSWDFPPLPTQKKIASILSGYDDLIENNLKRIKILEEMAQQTYEEWFVRMRFPGHESATINPEMGLPEGWEKVKLGDWIKTSSGGTPSKKKEVEYYENGTIPWVRTGELKNFILIDSEIKITESGLKNSSAKLFPKGTVLLAMYGNTIGETSYCAFETSTNQACCGFLVEKDYESYFIHQYLLNNKEHILSYRMGAAQENISQSIIQNIELIKPAEDILIDFGNGLRLIYDSIINLLNQNQRLREARDILLPRLMMGMVEV